MTAIVAEDDRKALVKEMIAILSLGSWSELLDDTLEVIRQHLSHLIEEEKIVTLTEEEKYASLLSINYRKQFKKLKASLKTPHGIANHFNRISLFKP